MQRQGRDDHGKGGVGEGRQVGGVHLQEAGIGAHGFRLMARGFHQIGGQINAHGLAHLRLARQLDGELAQATAHVQHARAHQPGHRAAHQFLLDIADVRLRRHVLPGLDDLRPINGRHRRGLAQCRALPCPKPVQGADRPGGQPETRAPHRSALTHDATSVNCSQRYHLTTSCASMRCALPRAPSPIASGQAPPSPSPRLLRGRPNPGRGESIGKSYDISSVVEYYAYCIPL
ncbi:MAG: hypothetical protein BWY76_02772 [bacterium ADurb.Bin429]|nr:MAG: hypothetical protein BWY76_02772 [bacterium ADurb.Bin429]